MNTHTLPRLSLAAAVALALSACGGSGGSGSVSTPPVATPPAPTAPVATVTLSGVVTDMPIPNATVVVTVDGQTFTAPLPTDANGAYSVDIGSDDPDALVSIDAFDPNGPARFSAIVDSFSGIEAQADDDGAVADVNVTNVTTAQAVLARRLTDDGSIDSVEELLDTASRVDAQDVLELSAAIKLVVESIGGVALPDDVTDTLALAEAIVEGSSTFIADVEAVAPGALASAVDLVLSDGNATIPFTADSAAGVYVAQDGMQIFALLPQGSGLTADHGFEGVRYFDWSVAADGTLELAFEGDEPYSESVTLLSRTSDIVNVVVRESGDDGQGEPATASYFSFDGGFDAQSLAGTYSTLDDPGHLTVFDAGGFGYNLNLIAGTQDDAFDYLIEEDGTLMLFDADGSVQSVRKLSGSTDTNLRLLVWERRADGSFDDVAIIEALRTSGVPASGGSDAAALLLAGNTYALTEAGDIALFTFGASGSISEISQFEGDQGWALSESTGSWSVTSAGTISTLFPGDDEPGSVTVMQGLGEDFMVVEADDGEMQQVTRVVPIDAALMTGSFVVQDDTTGVADGTVEFRADFSGTYVGDDGVGERFQWGLSPNGRMLLQFDGANSFDTETTTFYLLAGSSGDLLRFVLVSRLNGALRPFDGGAGETPDSLELLSLVRTGL